MGSDGEGSLGRGFFNNKIKAFRIAKKNSLHHLPNKKKQLVTLQTASCLPQGY